MRVFNSILVCTFIAYAAAQISGRLLYHELSKETFTDTRNKLKDDALFGYSVAYQPHFKSLIIGSPTASQRGKVYFCTISNKECHPVNVPIPEKNAHANPWFGATVNAGSNFFVACAPRLTENSMFRNRITGTVGQCFYGGKDYHPDINLRGMPVIAEKPRIKYHKLAYDDDKISPELLMDSFGWATHVVENSIWVGGPAMSIGRTMIYNKYDSATSPSLVTIDNVEFNKHDKNVSLNFGYSITSGYFYDNSISHYAISTPYGTYGNGRVLLFDHTGKFMNEDIEGDVVGSLFGAALCSMLIPDGFSALLVGAPASALSSFANGFDSNSYDVGAVYVYTFPVQQNKWKTVLSGSNKKGSYFGHAITNVGDLDGDEYDEVAIAAPYEDDGRGAVYLYSGKQLLTHIGEVKWMQRIVSENHNDRYFGLSLSALSDYDENGCNELAVGIPGSNKVTLYRCMASVKAFFQVTFPDLKKQAKELTTGESSFIFKSCLRVIYPTKPDPISSEIYINVEVIHPNVALKRIGKKYNLTENLTYRLPQYCADFTVELPQNADYDHAISFNFTAMLKKNPLKQSKFDPKLVLLNDTDRITQTFTAPSLPGSNMTFKFSTTLHDDYLIGSSENENLTLEMFNTGNTAYGACVQVDLTGVKVSKVSSKNCGFTGKTLICKAPSLGKFKRWSANVTLAAKELTSLSEKVEINAELLTRCEKRVGEPIKKIINLRRDYNITVTGMSTPSTAVNVTKDELNSGGKHFTHTYVVINTGITKWEKVKVDVQVLSYNTSIGFVSVGGKKCIEIGVSQFQCIINELKKNFQTNINVIIDILPDSEIIHDIKKKGSAKVETQIFVSLDAVDKFSVKRRVTTVVAIWEAPTIPIWMIVVAALVSLLVIVLICWVLHECGFLRRKHKDELKELKRDFKRHSMRQSKMPRESAMDMIPNDQQTDNKKLLDEVHEESDDGIYDETPKRRQQEDPALAAINAELARALNKGKQKYLTKADVHNDRLC